MTSAAEWARCRAWLLPAMSDTTEEVVLRELAAGRAQLWAGRRAALVTRLEVAPEPFVYLWLAGGDLEELFAFDAGVAAWARAHGARAARVNGRRGWRRVLVRLGFAPDGGDLRKAL